MSDLWKFCYLYHGLLVIYHFRIPSNQAGLNGSEGAAFRAALNDTKKRRFFYAN